MAIARIDSASEASEVLSWIAEHKDKPGVQIGYDGKRLEINSPSGKNTYNIAKDQQGCFAIKLNEITGNVSESAFAAVGLDSAGRALKDTEGALRKGSRGMDQIGRGDILGGLGNVLGGVTKGMGVGTPALSCAHVEIVDPQRNTPNVPPPPGARSGRRP